VKGRSSPAQPRGAVAARPEQVSGPAEQAAQGRRYAAQAGRGCCCPRSRVLSPCGGAAAAQEGLLPTGNQNKKVSILAYFLFISSFFL